MNIASPPSAHFPLEIFSVIISFTSDPGTLCSLARCCRAFTRSAEFYLYDTLKFAPGLKAIQLARALVRSSRRSSYVRDASVELIENAIQPILLPAGIKLIIRAIVGCPNLGSLSLSWGSWRVNWPARLLWPNTFQLHRFVSWFQWDQTICDFLKTQSSLNVLVTVRPVQLRGVAPEPEPHLADYALPFLSSFTGRLAQAVSVLPGRPVTSLALNGSVSLSEFESALPVLAQTSAQIESLALQTGELSSRLFTLLGAHIPTLTRLELRIVVRNGMHREASLPFTFLLFWVLVGRVFKSYIRERLSGHVFIARHETLWIAASMPTVIRGFVVSYAEGCST
ncbi:hypothetical protein RHS01_00820 [Rhizoctonia solani]|uniref:F-box domain-containing protein n=1 Tax=Rhizoctonia solani TaxID=456999 RepID=A0A8H7ILB8_9AGAM|nr:hypothetical protein RHS01_00820 [Rhizoctonia solani]